MRRLSFLILMGLAPVACGRSGDTVTIADDSGSVSLTYDCGNPRLGHLEPDQGRVILDYVVRLIQQGTYSDPDSLAHAMAAYEAKDWAFFERKVVAQACAEGVLKPTLAQFPDPGSLAPDFRLPLLDGSGLVSLREMRGRYVIVDFWATWCLPCIRELPVFEEWARESEDLVLLAVVFQDEPERALDWARRNLGEAAFVLEDPEGSVASSYGVSMETGIPKTFLLNPHGEVVPACDSCRYRANRPHFAEILGRQLGW